MARPARGLSLRTKWTLVLLAVALLPLLALGPITLKLQRAGLIDAENGLEAAIADQVAKSIEVTVSHVSSSAARVGHLITSASTANARDQDEAGTLVGLAQQEVSNTENLTFLVVYDKNGAYVDAIARTVAGEASRPVPRAALSPELVERAKAGGGVWTVGKGSDVNEGLVYTEPLRVKGEVTGFVRAFVTPGALSTLVGTASWERLSSPDAVFLVDDTLTVIAAPASGSLKVGDTLAGKYMFERMSAAIIPWDQSVIGASGSYAGPDGQTMRGSYSTLGRHRWVVVVQRPEREVLAALRGTQRAFVLAVLVVALLAVGIGSWLAVRSTRPIEALVELTRRYGKRDLEARANVATGDELEELSDSLAEMATSIRAGEAEIAKKTATEAQLSRYLPAEVARSIADGTRNLGLGGERREVTVIFADIASFTSFAERSSPEDVVAFLNEVFSILSEVVFRHGGMVDKFMGDCIMAVFGATEAEDDPERARHASRALAAAEDMHRFVETQAPEWKKRFDFDVRLGIGVTTGSALVGNLGSETRMEFTAIGDTVNTAARLESLAQAGQTLVSSEVATIVGDTYDLRPLGPHPIRGKREPVELFELVL